MDGKHKLAAKKIIKITAWIVGGFFALLAVALCALVWIMTPSRLTPLAQKEANSYLNAKVRIGRMELTAWSTFPDITLDVKDLSIVSKSLGKLSAGERAQLPANADSLIEFKSLHAGVNVFKLLIGSFSLKDLSLDGLNLNIVASRTVGNYDIFPPSKEPADTTPTKLPNIYWNRLSITNCRSITYYSASDSLNIHLAPVEASLDNVDGDAYHLVLKGKIDYSMYGMQFAHQAPYSFDGNIDWKSKKFLTFGIENLKVKILDMPATINAHLAMDDVPVIDKIDVNLGPVRLASVVPQLPQEYQDLFANISTNVRANLKLHLTKPYDIDKDYMPTVDATLVIPDSYLQTLNGKNRLNHLAMNADVALDGKKPDQSRITLNSLILSGASVNLTVKGVIENFFSDAHLKGSLVGKANLGRLIQVFDLPVNFAVKGDMTANTTFDVHASDFTANTFQRMKLGGTMNLNDFCFSSPTDTMRFYVRNARIAFGDNEHLLGASAYSGMLRFSAAIDTMSAIIPGMLFTAVGSNIGAGCSGSPAQLMDTTRITPFGGKLTATRIQIDQPGNTRIKVSDINCNADLNRFKGYASVPMMHFDAKVGKISYHAPTMAANLHDGHLNIFAHITPKPAHSRLDDRIDAFRREHPRMSNDVLLANMNGMNGMGDDRRVLDMSVGDDVKNMLLRWRLHGTLTSTKGKIYTPYFPLKNRLTNINLAFSTDSLIFHNVDYRVGHTKLNVKGGVHNLRTTLLGGNRRPLDLRFVVVADTINVNQLIKAGYDGMAYSAKASGLAPTTKSTTDTVFAAFIIPGNIDATVLLRSHNVIYADVLMQDFNGDLLMHDGVANLRNLHAVTDIGSANFNAMYAAPDSKNIKVAFDMGMRNIQVAKFLHLMPAVDSIMPLLNSVDGVINADMAATSNLDSEMNVMIPTLKAAVKLSGDSLVFMDAQTFHKIAKMLLFKHKDRNMIDNMTVQLLIDNSELQLYPFMFDVDRYKLGVLGHNDFNLNYRYHVSVLKSPIPFKFGINIFGTPAKMHFRFGGAKFKNNMQYERTMIVDTTRINLRQQMRIAFRRGRKVALNSNLRVNSRPEYNKNMDLDDDVSPIDSLHMIAGGYIDPPPAPAIPLSSSMRQAATTYTKGKARRKR
jgi:hypothetical protein